jgi:hypothetical protein
MLVVTIAGYGRQWLAGTAVLAGSRTDRLVPQVAECINQQESRRHFTMQDSAEVYNERASELLLLGLVTDQWSA